MDRELLYGGWTEQGMSPGSGILRHNFVLGGCCKLRARWNRQAVNGVREPMRSLLF